MSAGTADGVILPGTSLFLGMPHHAIQTKAKMFNLEHAGGPTIPAETYCVSHNIESFRPQRSLPPEGGDQARAAAHATERSSRRFAEFPVVLGANIRQFVLLPVGPDVLDRVQF